MFRRAIAASFQEIEARLKQDGKTPSTEIARVLGVSRQTAHQYLNGAVVPDTERLAKLVGHWGVTIDVEGHRFGKEAFIPPSTPSTPAPREVQLNLIDLDTKPIEINLPGARNKLRVDKKGTTIELAIDLRSTE